MRREGHGPHITSTLPLQGIRQRIKAQHIARLWHPTTHFTTFTTHRTSFIMSGYFYSDMSYCTLCDRYFPGEEARAAHVQLSSNHPKCDTCDRRFANKNSLRNVSPSLLWSLVLGLMFSIALRLLRTPSLLRCVREGLPHRGWTARGTFFSSIEIQQCS